MYNCSNGPIYIVTVTKNSLLQLNCVFVNPLFYCEVRYPICNQGNSSFIKLDIQRRFTENVLKWGESRLSSSCRNKKMVFEFRTIGPSDYKTFGLSDRHHIITGSTRKRTDVQNHSQRIGRSALFLDELSASSHAPVVSGVPQGTVSLDRYCSWPT